MAEAPDNKSGWYARPVFFVADVDRTAQFYIEMLGFWKKWHKDSVCQVNWGNCEIILSQEKERRDKSRLFVELNAAEIDALRRNIAERSTPFEKTWWGYDVIKVVDPDGNELLFASD
jgi:uncharacterized glyoxalase superfamily protein PhnB